MTNKIIKEMQENYLRKQKETAEINEKILQIPEGLTSQEEKAYREIITTLKESISYRLSPTDTELI